MVVPANSPLLFQCIFSRHINDANVTGGDGDLVVVVVFDSISNVCV